MAENRTLIEKFKGTLISILVLLVEQEDKIVADPMVRVQSLLGEYHAKAEAQNKSLNEQIAAEKAQISAKSTLIFCVAARCEMLQQ